MRGDGSSVGSHLAVWFPVAITQIFLLRFHNPQFYSGDMSNQSFIFFQTLFASFLDNGLCYVAKPVFGYQTGYAYYCKSRFGLHD